MPRGPLWTPAEEELARELMTRHVTNEVFKATLGRSKSSWCSRSMKLNRDAGIVAKKYCYTDAPWISNRPSIEMYREADERIMAPYRSQVAAFCGDPPLGYSALDKKEIGHAPDSFRRIC